MRRSRRLGRGQDQHKRWHGVSVASTSDYYQTSGATGIAGDGAGFWVAFPVRILTQAVASSTRRLAERTNYANQGWQFYTSTTHATITFSCYSGAGGFVGATGAIPVADIGITRMVHGVHTGSELRLFWNGAFLKAEPITGVTTFAGSTKLASPAVAPVSAVLCGLVGGHYTLSDAEVLAHSQACSTANDLVAIASKTDHLWSVKRDSASGVPATLTNQVGAANMTKVGSPTLVVSTG